MEESNPQDQRGPTARRMLIHQVLKEAGDPGVVTEEVVGRLVAAGLTSRRQTVIEDLTVMREAGLVEHRDGSWFLVEKNSPDDGRRVTVKEWASALAGLQVVGLAVRSWDVEDEFRDVVATLLRQARGELHMTGRVVEMLEDVAALAAVASTTGAWSQLAAKCRDVYDLFEAEQREAAEAAAQRRLDEWLASPEGKANRANSDRLNEALTDPDRAVGNRPPSSGDRVEDSRTVDDMPVRPDFRPDEGEAAPRTGVYRMTDDGGQVLEQPWIVVKSEGGPYDEDAFVAGVVCGQIQEMLSVGERLGMTMSVPILIPKVLSEQVDLIAMRFGYRLMFPAAWADPEYDSGYVKFTSELPPDDDDDGDLLDDSDSE